jgi:multimeric flavodoxin WrbA
VKITAFSGSHKGREGNTLIMVEEFLKGAKEAGAKTENLILAEKKILPCKGKFECWIKTPGKCTIRDDMDELLPRFIDSDIAVLAFPVYLENVPAIMKTFLERLVPALLPHFEETEKGEYRHAKRFEKYPKIVVISNSGLPGQVNFQAVSLLFNRFAKYFHTEVIAEIYRGEGEILSVKNLLAKPLVSKYKKLLQTAGKSIVENMEIPAELQEQLEKPIIPPSIYIKYGNEELERMLEKNEDR